MSRAAARRLLSDAALLAMARMISEVEPLPPWTHQLIADLSAETGETELRNSIARGYCQSFGDYSRDLAGAAIPLAIGDRRLSVVVAGPEFRIGPKVAEVAALIARTVERLRPKAPA